MLSSNEAATRLTYSMVGHIEYSMQVVVAEGPLHKMPLLCECLYIPSELL